MISSFCGFDGGGGAFDDIRIGDAVTAARSRPSRMSGRLAGGQCGLDLSANIVLSGTKFSIVEQSGWSVDGAS